MFTTKSRPLRSDFLNGHTSIPYINIGIYLLLINCSMISSEDIQKIFYQFQFCCVAMFLMVLNSAIPWITLKVTDNQYGRLS